MRGSTPLVRPPFGSWRPNTNSPQMNGLLSWWPLQPQAGKTFLDVPRSRVESYSGQSSGGFGTPIPDPVLGSVLNFDGTTSQLDLNGNTAGTDPYYTITGSVSLTAWIIPNVSTSAGIIQHRSSPGGETGDYGIQLDSSKHFQGFIFSGAFRIATGATVLSNGTRYHVVASFDDPGNTMTLYINGIQDASTSITQALTGALLPLHIGYTHISIVPQFRWNGGIADVRVYNRALTALDAWRLYDPASRWEMYDVPRPSVFIPSVTPPPSSTFSPFEVGFN